VSSGRAAWSRIIEGVSVAEDAARTLSGRRLAGQIRPRSRSGAWRKTAGAWRFANGCGRFRGWACVAPGQPSRRQRPRGIAPLIPHKSNEKDQPAVFAKTLDKAFGHSNRAVGPGCWNGEV